MPAAASSISIWGDSGLAHNSEPPGIPTNLGSDYWSAPMSRNVASGDHLAQEIDHRHRRRCDCRTATPISLAMFVRIW